MDPAPLLPTPTDGYYDSAYRGGPRLYGLALRGCDGGRLRTERRGGGPIDAIRINPGVKDVGLDKVTIWRFSGNGLHAQDSAALQFNQVHCTGNGRHGFTFGDAAGDTSTVAWLIVEPARA